MGSVIGGIVGGIGSIVGAKAQAKAAERAAELSLTGFNYLTKGPGAAAMQGYIDAGQQATRGQMATQNAYAELLGLPAPYDLSEQAATSRPDVANSGLLNSSGYIPTGGVIDGVRALGGGAVGDAFDAVGLNAPGSTNAPPAITYGPAVNARLNDGRQQNVAGGYQPDAVLGGNNPGQVTPQNSNVNPADYATPQGGAGGARSAFDNYLNSTGYQFRLGQGMDAITGGAASSGLLNSGGTLKALQAHGQNLASAEFGNYLNQLGGLNAAQGGLSQMGQNALGQIGSVGSTAGGGAANAVIQGGNAQAGGIAGAFSNFGSALTGALNGGFGGFGGGGYFPPAPRGGVGLY